MAAIDNAALDAAALAAIAGLQAQVAPAEQPDAMATMPGYGGPGPPPAQASASGAPQAVAPDFGGGGGGGSGGMQSGTVKSWFDDKGFGFIIPDGGGADGDVFVHRHALSDGLTLVQGSSVYFEMQWNAQKGKYSATKCMGAIPSPTGSTGAAPPVPVTGQLMTGTVKAWYEDKGFGFIIPQGGGDDVFVHRSSLQDGQVLTAAASVMYEVQWNQQKNKYGATKVFGAAAGQAGGMPGASGMPGMPTMGAMPGVPGVMAVQDWAAPSVAAKPPTEPSDNIFVAGLPPGSTDDFLKQIFGPYGNVLDCRVLPDAGRPDRAALIRMGDVEQAKWLVDNLNGNMPQGLNSPLTVRFADRNGGKGMGNGVASAPVATMVGGYGPACCASGGSDGYSPYGAMSAAAYGNPAMYGAQYPTGAAGGWMEVPAGGYGYAPMTPAQTGCAGGYDYAAVAAAQAAGGAAYNYAAMASAQGYDVAAMQTAVAATAAGVGGQ